MQKETEKEIKLLEVDSVKLRKKLIEVGATHKYRTVMTITSYDFFEQHGSLRRNNAHLRTRVLTHTDKIEFTFKYNVEHAASDGLKQALEYNAYLTQEDAEYLEAHAEQLGLQVNAVHEKKRDSYLLPSGCICDIDTYPGIPTYVELEGESQEGIDEATVLLDIAGSPRTQASGAIFFARYGQEFYSELRF